MAQRKKWYPKRMKAAIEAMRNKEMGSYKVSRVFNLPQTTLECYIKDWDKSSNQGIKMKLVGSKFGSTVVVGPTMFYAATCGADSLSHQ
jgi:hypothetical protein